MDPSGLLKLTVLGVNMTKQTGLIVWAITAVAFHAAAITLAYLGLLK